MSEQTKFKAATSPYDFMLTLLAHAGIHSPDQAYAACPDMNPRTVRRVFAEGKVMDDLLTALAQPASATEAITEAEKDTVVTTPRSEEQGFSVHAASATRAPSPKAPSEPEKRNFAQGGKWAGGPNVFLQFRLAFYHASALALRPLRGGGLYPRFENRGITPLSLKEKGDLLKDNPLPLTDTISPDDLNTLTEKAQQAGVKTFSAVTAVLRFGNPLERVVKVLDDIVTLAKTARPARSPSGLFVHAMRHGTDIKLPEGARATPEKKYPPLAVGEWVRWNLEWMRVMVIQGTQALLSPSGELWDSYKCPAENLLHLPRQAMRP